MIQRITTEELIAVDYENEFPMRKYYIYSVVFLSFRVYGVIWIIFLTIKQSNNYIKLLLLKLVILGQEQFYAFSQHCHFVSQVSGFTRIAIGKTYQSSHLLIHATATPPPNRTSFFCFCICFTEMYPRQTWAPPMGLVPPPPVEKSWFHLCSKPVGRSPFRNL